MYNTARNRNLQPDREGLLINGENYWPGKLKHCSSSHMKWVILYSDKPTIRTFVIETMAMETAAKPKCIFHMHFPKSFET